MGSRRGLARGFARACALALSCALLCAASALAAKPRLIADLNTAPGEGSSPTGFAGVGKFALFAAADSGIDAELWRTNGKASGTRLVKRIRPGSDPSNPHGFARLGKRILFAADDGAHGMELWRTDGTKRGTKLVRDINPGPGDALASYELTGVKLKGRLIFAASSGGVRQLWSTDGTKRGTRRIAPVEVISAVPPVRLGRHVYFSGTDSRGNELWRTDGTKRGTKLVKNIGPGPADGGPEELTKVGKLLVFKADDGTHGDELWRTRGTGKTTRLVKDVVTGPDPFQAYQFVAFGKRAFFQGDDGAHGFEPWVTDGTAKGTRMVRDINPAGSSMIYFSDPTRFAGRVVFSATDSSAPDDYELWVTDGKPNGTRKFELNPSGSSLPYSFTPVGRSLFFTADNGSAGFEPWIWRP